MSSWGRCERSAASSSSVASRRASWRDACFPCGVMVRGAAGSWRCWSRRSTAGGWNSRLRVGRCGSRRPVRMRWIPVRRARYMWGTCLTANRRDHWTGDHQGHRPPLACGDFDQYQVMVCWSRTSFGFQQGAVGGEPFPVTGTLDDDLVAGVGQMVQGAVA